MWFSSSVGHSSESVTGSTVVDQLTVGSNATSDGRRRQTLRDRWTGAKKIGRIAVPLAASLLWLCCQCLRSQSRRFFFFPKTDGGLPALVVLQSRHKRECTIKRSWERVSLRNRRYSEHHVRKTGATCSLYECSCTVREIDVGLTRIELQRGECVLNVVWVRDR